MPLWSLTIFIYSCIIINSNFAISLAHDLMHSNRRIDRLFANMLLIQNGFFYLKNDHLYIHHRYVATLHDPATAMYGENLYKYLFRSIISRLKNYFYSRGNFSNQGPLKIILSNYFYLLACIFLSVDRFIH
ncbi:MAG: fatty acid desaturase [Saprospiraceae bacterium]|nr:fatty acid desaturase [Candidatus Brachybacter algidus]